MRGLIINKLGQRKYSKESKRLVRKLLSGGIIAFFITLTGVVPAFAHGSVLSTSPVDSSQVGVAPTSITIEFNEQITISNSAVRVVNSSGSDVLLQEPQVSENGSKATLTSRFKEDLKPGWYAVSWNAISEDGHPISSTFTFIYGASDARDGQTAADVIDDPSAPFRNASGILRVLGYLATLLAIGLLIATWPLAPVPSAAESARKAAVWSAAAGLVITPIILLNNAVLLNGGSFENLKTTALIALQSNTGTALLVRVSALFGLCTAVLLAAERSTKFFAAAIGFIASIGLAVSYFLSGHASVVKWEVVAAPALVVHLLAGSVWLGGLPGLAWAYRKRSMINDDSLAKITVRFSAVATASVIAVFIAGLTLSVTMFSSPTQLTDDYGIALLIKISAVLVIAAIGAYNHFIAVPAMRKGSTVTNMYEIEDGSQDNEGGTYPQNEVSGGIAGGAGVQIAISDNPIPSQARRHLGLILKVEAFAIIVVAILTGVVTNNAAPAAGGSHSVHQGLTEGGHSGGSMIDIELQLALADLEPRTVLTPLNEGELQIDYRPARVDRENLFTFTATSSDGSVVSPSSVSIIAIHKKTGVGPIVRSALNNGNGTFSWSTRDLGIVGEWELEVSVTFDIVNTGVARAVVTIQPSALTNSTTIPSAR